MQEQLICPYPGLRPFNEDESIFFKGREEHIEQIVKQLEEKKFLMLTGASGDGKSSLVYAGVIPNARAGFFKAKFNNWIVADFRPEREPLTNMATAISTQLKINDIPRIEKELSYGFSSLIDIYKSSYYWVDQQSENFKQLTPDEQKKTKRKGANLLILVDQFEEFFTNPENYNNGKTSIESQAVVNSLLETTRLAIEQDVPIYIVCTMRSDYIGQCASFRGLPEYIGYSQFFVPRLKRKEIYQVIEEPALLNGNKISKRLVEMLINEMNDGIDQLPVLQHALNQIWQKADKGLVEMDLIHFAKINGIPKKQLSQKDKTAFETWFETLPDFKKAFFINSSLGNVLDAHANELFETSNLLIETIAAEDAKLIVETTFKCLTKIDEARAVRNRMTLEEVTQIINKPNITNEVIAKVLYVFRIQGNTFLKPFIFDEVSATELSNHSVLDITHESLIRNWKKLTDWAKEEYDNLLTWQDFNKQLQRYINSHKSSGYLLPIGPLTFFENWFNTAKPNAYWLVRYDEREISKEQKLADAENTLANAHQFIKRSARRLFVNRTVIKYGADRIIAVFAILLFLISCTYFYSDFRKKQNEYVVNDLQKKSKELLKSKYIKNKVKADYILTAERLNPGTYKDLLKNIPEDSSQIDIVREMFTNCLTYQQGKKDNEPDNRMAGRLFMEQLRLIESKDALKTNTSLVRNINNILATIYGHIILIKTNYPFNGDKDSPSFFNIAVYQKFCDNTYRVFIDLLKDPATLKKIDIEKFNELLQAMPEVLNYDTVRLKQIADLISPFDAKTRTIFDILYPKEKTVQQDWNNTITHNSGYYQMANLYALTNNFDDLNRSFDSILYHNKNFLNVGYGYSYNRFIYDLIITNKLFTKNGENFIAKIESKFTVKKNYPLNTLIINSLLNEKTDIYSNTITSLTANQWTTAKDLQLQLEHISYKQLNSLADGIIVNNIPKEQPTMIYFSADGEEHQKKPVNDLKTDEKNYMVALLYKAKAFANNKKENFNPELINDNLRKAFSFYEKISAGYLKGDINLGEGSQIKTVTRTKVFKYPFVVSLTQGYNPFNIEEWNSSSYKDKAIFIDYVTKEKNLADFYFKTDEDGETLNQFLINYYGIFKFSNEDEKAINLKPFEDAITKNTLSKKIDKNALLSFITVYYHHLKKDTEASKYAARINFKEFLTKEKISKDGNSSRYYTVAKNLLNYYWGQPLKIDLDLYGLPKIISKDYRNAFDLLEAFPEEFEKRNALLMNIDSLQRGAKDIVAIPLLDTLLNVDILQSSKFGNKLFEILGRLSTEDGDKIAMTLMKDRLDKIKPNCLNFFIDGKAQSSNYYKATTFIPDYVSSSSQLALYTTILKNEVKKRKTTQNDGWSAIDDKTDGDNWVTGAYEEGEGMTYITSE